MNKGEYTVNPEWVENKEEISPTDDLYVVTVTDKDKGEKIKANQNHAIEVIETKPDKVDIDSIDLGLDLQDDEVDEWGGHEYVDLDQGRPNVIAFVVTLVQKSIIGGVEILQKLTKGHFFSIIFLMLYFAYFIAAMIYEFGDEGSNRLLACTIFGAVVYSRGLWFRGLRWLYFRAVGQEGMNPSVSRWLRLIIRWFLYLAVVGIIVWSIVDNFDNTDNIRGLPGFVVFLVLCLLFSCNPKKINWHTIFWGVGMQFLFGICTLKYDFGQDVVEYVQDRLDEFFANSRGASTLIFGPETAQHQILFESLPVIFMTSAFLGLLYYFGAMQFVIKILGAALSYAMDTQPAESIAVAAGIFLDGTSAVLSLGPLLEQQSKSQLFLILTSCFASLGGFYLAMLSQFGLPLATILPAMLISAPATFAVSKLLFPESRPKNSKLNSMQALSEDSKSENPFEVFRAGAILGLPLIGNVIAIGFSYVAAISWMNHTLEWFGERVGKKGFTLEYLLSYLFYPVALAMGIKPDECRLVGKILGIRLLSTNFIAFLNMLPMIGNRLTLEAYMAATNNTGPIVYNGDTMFLVHFNKTLYGEMISERSQVITTFSLCGFSSFLTMAFTIAAFYTLVPVRRPWLSKVSIPALLAGNIANCMTACVASLFY